MDVKTRAFKALQTLENDLATLYQIQVKYLEKLSLKNNKPNGAAAGAIAGSSSAQTTANSVGRFSTQSKTSSAYLAQSKQIEKLVNHTPIGKNTKKKQNIFLN